MKEVVLSQDAPKPVGPYSQAIKSWGFLFISGQLGFDNNGNLPASTKEQTYNALINIEKILKSCSLSFEHIVKTTIFFTNKDDFSTINEVYSQFFSKDYPARSAIVVLALPKNASVEIEAIAKLN